MTDLRFRWAMVALLVLVWVAVAPPPFIHYYNVGSDAADSALTWWPFEAHALNWWPTTFPVHFPWSPYAV